MSSIVASDLAAIFEVVINHRLCDQAPPLFFFFCGCGGSRCSPRLVVPDDLDVFPQTVAMGNRLGSPPG
jgi:hypothetical protein